MRAYRTWAAFVSAAFCSALPLNAQAPQMPNKPYRDFGGWQAVPAARSAPAQVRQANFQAPGQEFGSGSLPPLPSGFGGASLPQEIGSPPSLPRTSSPSAGPLYSGEPTAEEAVMQAGGPTDAYDQFSNPGGQLPVTDVRQASGSGLRSAVPPGGAVYPPQTTSQTPHSHLRSTQTSNVAQQRQLHNGTEYNIPVVSQDPRFISPPPAPRVGNYATSPYQSSPFRLAAYQVNQQVPAQVVQAPAGQTGQPAVVANTSTLPQFQPTVGIRQASYQQCGPSMPVGGVPQVVPGAVAPPTLPPNLTPQLYTPDNAGYKPLISLGQENYNVLLGRGIVGQPTVYVPGQPFRNFFRYLSP